MVGGVLGDADGVEPGQSRARIETRNSHESGINDDAYAFYGQAGFGNRSGEHDLACHAVAGRTERTAPLYGAPGIAYVYFIYGMYWCFNAVTRGEHEPSAVLVRAVEPVQGIELMRARRPKAKRDVDLTNGPGKLCLALGIGREQNWHPLQRPPLVIRAGDIVRDADVVVTPRIGISEWAEAPLRYFIRDNPYVSKTPRDFPRTALADEPLYRDSEKKKRKRI